MKYNVKDILRSIFNLVKNHDLKRVASPEKKAKKHSGAWLSKKIPLEQWGLAEVQLKRFEASEPVAEFDVFNLAIEQALKIHPDMNTSVLEIGCASGYYGRVLAKAQPQMSYVGIDYSKSFIDLGKSQFPDLQLYVGDTRDLSFTDKSFGMVVSGGVLLHVYEWKTGLQESCRVADDCLILHRTPVSESKTELFTKIAYGKKMIQWTFNESELIGSVEKYGFQLIEKWPVYQGENLSKSAELPSQFTYLFLRQ